MSLGLPYPSPSIKGITVVVATTCMVLTLWMRPLNFKEFPVEALLGLFTKLSRLRCSEPSQPGDRDVTMVALR